MVYLFHARSIFGIMTFHYTGITSACRIENNAFNSAAEDMNSLPEEILRH